MDSFRLVVRGFAMLALVTGAADVAIGLSGQQMIGAALSEGYTDPLLNSQVRYLGSIWFGFGALLWYCLNDVKRHAAILGGAFLIVFLGGLGRIASLAQFGFPPSESGTGFVVFAIAIEILGMPLLLLWLRRVVAIDRHRVARAST